MTQAHGVRLLSVGTVLSGPPLDIAALARRFDLGASWEQWVEAFVGTGTRYLSFDLDSGEVRQWLADLGETAAGRTPST